MPSPDVEVKLDDINVDIQSDSTMDIDADIDANLRNEIVIPEPIQLNTDSDFALDVKPLKTDSTFAIPEPIVMDSSSTVGLDIEPMAVDFCFKFELGALPETKIDRPYEHRLGFSVLGQELFSLNLSGSSAIVIKNLPKRPQIIGGGHHAGHGKGHKNKKGKGNYRSEAVGSGKSGFNIRLE